MIRGRNSGSVDGGTGRSCKISSGAGWRYINNGSGGGLQAG